MSIRQKFEEWAGDQGFCLTRTFDGDGYQDLRTQGPWDAWQAAIAPPEGYVLAPVEPTEAMIKSFNRRDELPYNPSGRSIYKAKHCYAAMLAARPEVK